VLIFKPHTDAIVVRDHGAMVRAPTKTDKIAYAGHSTSSMRGKPCGLCCPNERTRMSCFAISGVGYR
jgi:hypothetical protein